MVVQYTIICSSYFLCVFVDSFYKLLFNVTKNVFDSAFSSKK